MSKNALRGELIGLRVKTTDFVGTVIDETKHTFTIQTTTGEKKVNKNQHTFTFTFKDGRTCDIEGGKLVAKPEERTKKQSW